LEQAGGQDSDQKPVTTKTDLLRKIERWFDEGIQTTLLYD
jgi:hypothetical protein